MNKPEMEDILLPTASMGNQRSLRVVRYGNETAGRKAYIQAALHADEPPGILVIHHLMSMLDKAAASGEITGEIVLVPAANPVGLAQWRQEGVVGRFDFATGVNFNRDHFDIAEDVAELVEKKLSDDPGANVFLIRRAMADTLATMSPVEEAAVLKNQLLRLACDADIVLDLHCDLASILHVYLGTPLWPDASDLPAQLGAPVTLLADDSGVTPFDEACSRLWWRLADRFPEKPIPLACLSATVELRGYADVGHDVARQDAANILLFLMRRGFVRGQVPDLPLLAGAATPLAGVEDVVSPVAGIVVFCCQPGDWIHKGDIVAEVINPLAQTAEDRICRIAAGIDGILYAHNIDRYARPGRTLARIAGKNPLKKSGENLLPS